MSSDLILITGLIILGFALIMWFLNKKLSSPKNDQSLSTLTEWLKVTQADIKSLQQNLTTTLLKSDKNVTDTLQKSYTEMNQRLDNAAKVIGELKLETGKFSEIGRSMKDLQDFLNSPKLRGNIGEQVLGDLLAQVLPSETYALQYRFRSGDIVDAVIKTQAGIIPIDSKFPMENFIKMNQAETKKDQEIIKKLFVNDVRKHIRAIAEKYINTAERTVDFALMYLPSETMYYEITAQTAELSDYAQKVRVLPVSPSTFYAFLRTILVSFEGQRIAQEAQTVLRSLRDIQKSSTDFGDKLQVLSRHVTNAYNNMNAVSADFNQLQTKIDTTRTLGTGMAEEKALPSPSDN
jgi:DNA recombination protein RmuC